MEKKIGDKTYRVDKMTATVATQYMFRIGKAAAPLLPALKGINIASLMGPQGDDSKTLEMIAGFLKGLDPVEGQSLLVELCEKAEVQGPQGNYEPVIFDVAFSGNVMDAFKVAGLVVQVNFSDFFGGKSVAK